MPGYPVLSAPGGCVISEVEVYWTGWDVIINELLHVDERRLNLQHDGVPLGMAMFPDIAGNGSKVDPDLFIPTSASV